MRGGEMTEAASKRSPARERAGDLQIEYRALEQLIPYARNARTHSDTQVAEIAGSIRAFGFTNPILVRRGGGRHCRSRAAGSCTAPRPWRGSGDRPSRVVGGAAAAAGAGRQPDRAECRLGQRDAPSRTEGPVGTR